MIDFRLYCSLFSKIEFRGVQEVILGQTPHIVPEMEGWLGQDLFGHTQRTEDFY